MSSRPVSPIQASPIQTSVQASVQSPVQAPVRRVGPAGSGDHTGHLHQPDALAREQFTISDLSAEFGVTARALRFYEDEGLIAPTRSGLSRIYSKRDRARLAWIMRARIPPTTGLLLVLILVALATAPLWFARLAG